MRRKIIPAIILASLFCTEAKAMETDQFLTWDVELQDSSDLINNHINNELSPKFLHKVNRRTIKPKTRQEFVEDYYEHLHTALIFSNLKEYINNSPEVDIFPPREVSRGDYKKASIIKSERPFPWCFMPSLSRTINVNGVYLGVDKISHFFGLGNAGFSRYNDYRKQGFTDQEAKDKTIRIAIHRENMLYGLLGDGIFSPADIEADYQGMQMAIDLSSDETPYFELQNGIWTQLKPIDLSRYITPDFDESYNHNHFWLSRKKKVHQRTHDLYCSQQQPETARQRFERYDAHEKSYAQKYVEAHFAKRKRNPRELQSPRRMCEGRH